MQEICHNMNKRIYIRRVGALSLGSLLPLGLCLAGPVQVAAKTNFVLFIADDCTHSDLACYGGKNVKTPNIDRLAAEGVQFTRCFQSAPMCSPTRHNLFTGMYPTKTGAYPNHTFVQPGSESVVQYLKPHGYRVALAGKRHIVTLPPFWADTRETREAYCKYLAGRPANAGIQKKLDRVLRKWMRKAGDRGQATEMEALEHQVKGSSDE